MQTFIISIMNQFGYIGILLLIAVENLFPPIPSEVILTFGGFMCSFSNLHVFGVIFSATLGSLLGALALYYIGYLIKPSKLACLMHGKLGKLLHVKADDIDKAQLWFKQHGKKTVLFCRFLPVIRSLISIPAGMAHMQLSIFLMLTMVGSFIWNAVLVYAGVLAGSNWEVIVQYVKEYSIILLCFTIAGGFWLATRYLKRKK